jgi:hypothetical protein
VAADLDTEFGKQSLGEGARRDAAGRLPRTGALEDVARVDAIVLEDPGEIGVARTGGA